ncbi:MAG: hypothetical protein R2865_05165 [Deinococcales bacterium]
MAGKVIEDNWLVMGRNLEAQQQLKELRIWLWGEKSQQTALLIKRSYKEKKATGQQELFLRQVYCFIQVKCP